MAKYQGSNRYLGAWAYILLGILYFIPVIGWVFMIIHSCSKSNENLCHFARSRLLGLVISLVIAGLLGFWLMSRYENVFTDFSNFFSELVKKL